MKKNNPSSLLIFLFSLLFFGFQQMAYADSPITSTELQNAYPQHPMVIYAKTVGTVDSKIYKALTSKRTSYELRASIINALGWSIQGKPDLVANYQKQMKQEHRRVLNCIDSFNLGYLAAIGDYFQVQPALQFFEKAGKLQKKNQFVQLLHVLIQAQQSDSQDSSQICKNFQDILARPNDYTTKVTTNMLPVISDYMQKWFCSGTP